MKSFFRVLYIIFINVFIILLFLVIIDPFLSIAIENTGIKRNVLLKELSPNSNYTIAPSDLYLQGAEGLAKKNYSVRTDKNGFLIGPRNYPIDSANVDVIFFGGSTTACLFVDESKRFPLLVQDKLIRKSTGINLTVLNGGVSGNNTLHSLVNLVAKGIPLQPKVIVLMENVNDLSLLSKTGSYWKAPLTKAIIQDEKTVGTGIKSRTSTFGKATKNLLFPNIYDRINNAISKMTLAKKAKSKQVVSDEDEFENYRNNPVPDFEMIRNEYEKMLTNFIRVAQANHIEVVLMTQFNRLTPEDAFVRAEYNRHFNKLNYTSFCKYYANFNQLIRDLAISEKIPLIDLDKAVPKTKTFVFDAVHLNNTGSEFVADIVAGKLTEMFSDFRIKNKK